MSARRLYRAVAHYEDDVVTRCFQTKRARDEWAAERREGYEAEPPNGFNAEGREAIPPARVEVADSDPITFPGDEPARRRRPQRGARTR